LFILEGGVGATGGAQAFGVSKDPHAAGGMRLELLFGVFRKV